MEKFNRRTLMAAGATIVAGGILGSLSAAADDGDAEGSGSEEPTGVAWQYDGPYDLRSTVVTDGRLYTLADGGVYALDTDDGSVEWETGDIGAMRELTVEGGRAFVGGDSARAIDAETGEILWENGPSDGPIVAGDGMVYTASDQDVYGLDAEDGSVQWERENFEAEWDDHEETIDDLVLGDAADGVVYVYGTSAAGGAFAGLDPTTGETEVTVTDQETISQLIAGSGHVSTFPAHDQARLFDVSSGEVVRTVSPAWDHSIAGDTYFTVDRFGLVTVADLSATAESLWEVEEYHGLPALSGETVVSPYGPTGAVDPDEENRVMAYDRETGEELWRYTFDDQHWNGADAPIAADEETVYVSREEGLVALRDEDDESEEDDEPDDGGEDEEPVEDDPELPPFEEPDGWSSYYGSAGNTGSIPENGAFSEPETLAWEHEESGHVAVSDGRVYLRSGSGLHALDEGDGSVVWTNEAFGTEAEVEYGTPAVAGETVVVGGDGLTALDADSGEVRWSQEFEAVTSPTVAYDTVFVVADETLNAFDLADGSLRWSRESVDLEPHEDSDLDDSQEVTFVSTPAAVSNEFVYAGVGHDDPEGVAAFDVLAGETQWTHTVDEETTRYANGVHEYILATENGVHTLGTFTDQGLYYPVLDPRTGEEMTPESESLFRPAVTDEVRVSGGRHGFSVEHDGTDEEWGRGSPGDEWSYTDAWRRPAIAGETLVIPYYVGAPDGHENDGLYGFDLEDGTEQWYVTHPDVDIADIGEPHGFAVSGESVYVTGGDRLQVLRPETEESEDEPDEEEPEKPEEDEPDEEDLEEPEEEEPEDDEQEARSLELSVSAPDSIGRGESASFDVTVWNHGDGAADVAVTLEVGGVSDSTTVEIAPGDCYASFHTVPCEELSVGDTEWTVTAGEQTESGILTVAE